MWIISRNNIYSFPNINNTGLFCRLKEPEQTLSSQKVYSSLFLRKTLSIFDWFADDWRGMWIGAMGVQKQEFAWVSSSKLVEKSKINYTSEDLTDADWQERCLFIDRNDKSREKWGETFCSFNNIGYFCEIKTKGFLNHRTQHMSSPDEDIEM